MKNKKTLKPVLPVLMVFFMLQLLSHLFLELGKGKTSGKKSGLFKMSALLMPLDAESTYRYAYALLFENVESQNNEMILKSIHAFEKSLHHNVLFYRAHYYLGKALFLYNLPGSPYFDRTVRAFKRAALIRGNKNSNISMDTLLLLLSQWPLLDNEGKTFCRDLLEKSIGQLGGKDFNSILEVWRLYSRDIDFFKGILKTNPEYYLNIARELSRMGINLEIRQDFLARYEVYYLDWLKTTFQKYREQSDNLLERLKYLHRIANIEGYYRLVKNTDFNEKDYLDFKKGLNLHILQLLFDQGARQTDTIKREEIERYIFNYFDEPLSRMEVESFAGFLKKYDFFAPRDLKAFYIKQLVHFKLGDYTQVIEDSEGQRQSVAFVQREQLNDYTDILLLLSDAFYKNKLLARAMSILEEIEKISPGLPGTYWRMLKIESIIGADNKGVGKEEETRAVNYQKIRDSRFIEPGTVETHKTVYLIDSDEIVIRIGDKLKEIMKSRNLFQVFIDGKIYYEAYISQLKEEDNAAVKFGENVAKCEVSVKIL